MARRSSGRGRVLEQVARGAGTERREHVAVAVVGRQHEHPRRRTALRECLDRLETADTGHPQVHEDDVGRERVHERERLGAVGGFAHDLEVRLRGQHAPEAVANDRVIVGDEHADGTHRVAAEDGSMAMAGTRAEIAVP